jgi:microcystin-dependent protein
MSAANLCPILQENQWTDNAQFLAGGLMWFYYGGTTTPLTVYTDSTALTAWPNPIPLNARGETGGEIWLQAGQYYKIVLEGPPLSGQTHGVTISTYDQISGINDATLLLLTGDWETFGGTPTFLTSSSFSVSGDNRALLQQNRRLKLSCANGLQYGTIFSASFTGSVTNITLRMDAGNALDSGLSSFQYGLIQTNPSSIPVAVQTGTRTSGSSHQIYIDYDGTNLDLAVDGTTFGATWPINISGTAAIQVLPGSVIMWASNTAPSSYLECNGAAISRTTYATLFAAIGTVFGAGDGSTTFNIPDLRAQFVRGWDHGQNIDQTAISGTTTNGSNSITGLSATGFMFVGMGVTGSGVPSGSTVASIVSSSAITISANATASSTVTLTFSGRAFGSKESGSNLSHTHTDSGHAHGISPGAASYNNAAGGGGSGNVQTQSNITGTQIGNANIQSSGGPENRPVNVALMYIIKT